MYYSKVLCVVVRWFIEVEERSEGLGLLSIIGPPTKREMIEIMPEAERLASLELGRSLAFVHGGLLRKRRKTDCLCGRRRRRTERTCGPDPNLLFRCGQARLVCLHVSEKNGFASDAGGFFDQTMLTCSLSRYGEPKSPINDLSALLGF